MRARAHLSGPTSRGGTARRARCPCSPWPQSRLRRGAVGRQRWAGSGGQASGPASGQASWEASGPASGRRPGEAPARAGGVDASLCRQRWHPGCREAAGHHSPLRTLPRTAVVGGGEHPVGVALLGGGVEGVYKVDTLVVQRLQQRRLAARVQRVPADVGHGQALQGWAAREVGWAGPAVGWPDGCSPAAAGWLVAPGSVSLLDRCCCRLPCGAMMLGRPSPRPGCARRAQRAARRARCGAPGTRQTW
jgi:hypothetical protein